METRRGLASNYDVTSLDRGGLLMEGLLMEGQLQEEREVQGILATGAHSPTFASWTPYLSPEAK